MPVKQSRCLIFSTGICHSDIAAWLISKWMLQLCPLEFSDEINMTGMILCKNADAAQSMGFQRPRSCRKGVHLDRSFSVER